MESYFMLEETFSSLNTTWIDFSVNCHFFRNTTGHKILWLWVFSQYTTLKWMLWVFKFSFPIVINALISVRQETNEELIWMKSTSPWITQRKWTGNNLFIFSINYRVLKNKKNKWKYVFITQHPHFIVNLTATEVCARWILTYIFKKGGQLHEYYVY